MWTFGKYDSISFSIQSSQNYQSKKTTFSFTHWTSFKLKFFFLKALNDAFSDVQRFGRKAMKLKLRYSRNPLVSIDIHQSHFTVLA